MGFLKKRIRTLAGAAVLCLLLAALPASVYADDQSRTSGLQTGQDSRTMLTTKVNGYPDAVEKGSGEVTLDDGTAVTVEGDSLPDGLLLVVEHIREEENGEIHDWIETCMKGLGTNLRVYDIYFVDSNGQRYETDGQITVTISLNGAYKNPSVYYVSSEGSVTRAESNVSGDEIAFVTTLNSYYVLAEQSEASTEPAPTPGDETDPTPTPGDGTEPTTAPPGSDGNNQETGAGSGETGGNSAAQGTGAKTGDETNIVFWLLMFISSAVCISGMIFRRKHTS